MDMLSGKFYSFREGIRRGFLMIQTVSVINKSFLNEPNNFLDGICKFYSSLKLEIKVFSDMNENKSSMMIWYKDKLHNVKECSYE